MHHNIVSFLVWLYTSSTNTVASFTDVGHDKGLVRGLLCSEGGIYDNGFAILHGLYRNGSNLNEIFIHVSLVWKMASYFNIRFWILVLTSTTKWRICISMPDSGYDFSVFNVYENIYWSPSTLCRQYPTMTLASNNILIVNFLTFATKRCKLVTLSLANKYQA